MSMLDDLDVLPAEPVRRQVSQDDMKTQIWKEGDATDSREGNLLRTPPDLNVCMKRRPCGHMYEVTPNGSEVCSPCNVVVRRRCHCDKHSIRKTCAEWQEIDSLSQEDRELALSCGKVCNRELLNCGHPCTAICHSGPCPQAWDCGALVTVRCKCKRRKAKWLCRDVQAAVQEAMHTRRHVAFAKLPHLLPCNSKCKRPPSKPKPTIAPDSVPVGSVPMKAAALADADMGTNPAARTRATVQAALRKMRDTFPSTAAEREEAARLVAIKSVRRESLAGVRCVALHMPGLFSLALLVLIVLSHVGMLDPYAIKTAMLAGMNSLLAGSKLLF